MPILKVYTREAVDRRTYPTALAGSVHFAVGYTENETEPLNYNYGVLYPQAEISAENTILERNIASPKVIRTADGVTFVAVFTDPAGEDLAPDSLYVWTTKDFTEYENVGPVKKTELGFDADTAPTVIEITDTEYETLVKTLGKLRFSHIELPENVTVSDVSELEAVKAEAVYSDGSKDIKDVKWDVSAVNGEGEYTVTGEVQQKKYAFPLVRGFADPVVFPWEGKWYFIATNDITGSVGLFVRGADTLDALFAPDNIPSEILSYDEERGFIQTFWAPEFHVIGGELCILMAIGGKKWAPQSHILKLKKGGDILDPDAWETPVRITLANGQYITETGITLDMTFFRFGEKSYYCWSQRWFGPDSGSMLYIAEVDEASPEKLASDPVLLSRPLYGWENQSGTVNNEGPYPLYTPDRLYLNYSGGAAGGYSYVSAYLMLEQGSDPLDPSAWKKSPCPVTSSVMFADREGPAHGAFFTDTDGKIYYTCHAQLHGQDGKRNTGITRVHFDASGFPVLGLEPSEDLPEDKKTVSIRVTVKK